MSPMADFTCRPFSGNAVVFGKCNAVEKYTNDEGRNQANFKKNTLGINS